MYNTIKYPNIRKSSYIQIQSRMLHHNTRSCSGLLLPRFRINQVKNNYEYQALITWDTLPENIKKSKSINIFKKRYIEFVIKDYCVHDI